MSYSYVIIYAANYFIRQEITGEFIRQPAKLPYVPQKND